MREENYWIGALRNPMKKAARLVGIAAGIAALPAAMVYIFAFSIKTSSEYRCAMQILGENRRVVSVTGSPVRPGLIAWTKYFESGGMVRQGVFWTYVTGPEGSGTVDVGFYRAPVGASLEVWFNAKGEELLVYQGRYPCEE